jgi:hypothetical protein
LRRDITVEQLLEEVDDCFGAIGKDPICTVLGHYFHSGAYRFHAVRDLLMVEQEEQSTDYNSQIEQVRKEILSELPNPILLQKKQKSFLQKNGFASSNEDKKEYGRICACACCGMKDAMTFSTVAIKDLEELLSVPDEDPFINILEHTTEVPVDFHGKQFGTISIKDILRWHYSSHLGKWLYLHKDFVDSDPDGVESCMLCPTCFKSLRNGNKIPQFSLANINLGSSNCITVVGKKKLQDLEQLTELERMIVSPARLFHTILKLQENSAGMTTDRSRSALRGHFILFPHDSVKVSSETLLSKKAWAENFSIEFVCRKGKRDHVMQSIWGTSIISGRAYVIIQYLRVFALMRQEPFKDDVTLLSLQLDLDVFKKELIDTALVNECDHMADVQDQMDADIAQVRSTTSSSTTGAASTSS